MKNSKLITTIVIITLICVVFVQFTACGGKNNHEHNYEESIVAPTMKNEGYTLHKCTGCGDEYKDSFTEKLSWKKVFASYMMEKGKKETNSSGDEYYIIEKKLKAEYHYISLIYFTEDEEISVTYDDKVDEDLYDSITLSLNNVREKYSVRFIKMLAPYSAIGRGYVEGKSIYSVTSIPFDGGYFTNTSSTLLIRSDLEEAAASSLRVLCKYLDIELKNINPEMDLSYWNIIYN